ncbi:MAG TPA: hypothetical protein VGJ33_21150 [Candidatus Angelobacter sp.]|jgi:hypothetical protein
MSNIKSLVPLRFISRANWQKSLIESTQKLLAMTLMLALITATNSTAALGQEVDSAQLQQSAAAETKTARQEPQDSAAQSGQAVPSPTQPQNAQPQTSGPSSPQFTLPAGTKLPLGLLRPLTAKAGKDVYLQITFPVTAGNQMLIPPGTYVQGAIQKIIRHDRRRDILEFQIHSANMIFSNGYTVPIAGIVNVATTNAALQMPQPGNGNGQPAIAMAAVGGPPSLPPLPTPSLGNGPRNALIAVGAIAAVGATVGILLARRGEPEIEAGTPMQIVLPAALVLDGSRVMAAVQQYSQQTSNAPPQIVQPPVKPKICYDPGTPGTPDTVIPGSSGTPATVIPGMNGMPDTVIPGTPSTPDTVIPGTPGTPSSSYPCPR